MKTLEQIKEHFKNAKIVECLYDEYVLYDITKLGSFDVLHNSDIVYLLDTSQNDYANVYKYNSKDDVFATIIKNK